jgi:hypothetical protein
MATASYTPTVRAARRAAWDASRAARMAGLDAAAARQAASDAARAAFRAAELSEAVKDAVAAVDAKLLQQGNATWGEAEVAELRERRSRKSKLTRGMALRG